MRRFLRIAALQVGALDLRTMKETGTQVIHLIPLRYSR
jgi:hypothetical protein